MATPTTSTIIDGNAAVTAKSLNQQLKDAGLWKPGCQFLSNKDKQRLLQVKDKTRKTILKELDTKLAEISQKLKETERNYTPVFSEETAKSGVHIIGNVEQLKEFATPVKEDKVFFSNGTDMVPAPKHKAIVTDEGKIISVVKQGYHLVRNEELILPVLEQLDKLDNKWFIDHSHSFMTDTKMRIQITFPELTFNDGKSDIAMSMFLHNSYDGSEGVKALWGAIRGICSNGMVFGEVFSRFYAKHTNNFSTDGLKEQIEASYEIIPTIKDRVELLKATEFVLPEKFDEQVTKDFGAKAFAYFQQENAKDPIKDMWQLYNMYTYYISHYVNYKTRAMYQQRLAKQLSF